MMQVRDSMPGQNTRVSMFHQPMLWCHPVAPLLLLLVEFTPVEAQCWHVKLWGGSNTIVNNEVTGHKYCGVRGNAWSVMLSPCNTQVLLHDVPASRS